MYSVEINVQWVGVLLILCVGLAGFCLGHEIATKQIIEGYQVQACLYDHNCKPLERLVKEAR